MERRAGGELVYDNILLIYMIYLVKLLSMLQAMLQAMLLDFPTRKTSEPPSN